MARLTWRVLKPLERWGTAVENALLVLLLGAMIVLASAQIALRLFFDAGIIWADEALKILVLWIAMVGSVATSRNRRHLRIDLSHFLPERLSRWPMFAVDAFAAVVCGFIAWHTARYLVQFASGETVLLGIPAWTVQGILPVAFGLMAYRFTLHSLKELAALFGQGGDEPA